MARERGSLDGGAGGVARGRHQGREAPSAVQRVGGDPGGEASADELGRQAVRLALRPGLGSTQRTPRRARAAGSAPAPQRGGPPGCPRFAAPRRPYPWTAPAGPVDSSSRCPSGSSATSTASHMCRTMTSAARWRRSTGQPAGCPEDPGDVAARLLERHPMTVELLHQADVVEHGRYVEQLRVEGDASRHPVPRGPEVGPHGMIEQRGRAVRGGHLQRRARGRGSRNFQLIESHDTSVVNASVQRGPGDTGTGFCTTTRRDGPVARAGRPAAGSVGYTIRTWHPAEDHDRPGGERSGAASRANSRRISFVGRKPKRS
jgi:hypothetical protein